MTCSPKATATMAERRIDRNSPFDMGYTWARLGMPANEGNPFLTERQRREWKRGFDVALAKYQGASHNTSEGIAE